MNKEIENNCDTIIQNEMSWEEAKNVFNLCDGNIQAIYLRYIIIKYGIKKAKICLKTKK